MSRRTVRGAAIVLLLAGGCARTSTNVRTYVASRPGLRLHYRLTDNGASTELTTIIAGESTFAGERVVPRTDWVDGKAMRARYLRVDATEAALVGDAGPAVGLGNPLIRGEAAEGLPAAESWGNPATLARHFADHGADFGSTSAEVYAQDASAFLQRAQAEGLPTKVDGRGVIRVYDPATNTFGAYNANGTTRTFYKPDPSSHGLPTNLDYWNSQPGASPWQP